MEERDGLFGGILELDLDRDLKLAPSRLAHLKGERIDYCGDPDQTTAKRKAIKTYACWAAQSSRASEK